jgi:hypothetical protein
MKNANVDYVDAFFYAQTLDKQHATATDFFARADIRALQTDVQVFMRKVAKSKFFDVDTVTRSISAKRAQVTA